MYTLLSGLWKYWFQKDEYFVLILGLDNAGKTVSILPGIGTDRVSDKTSVPHRDQGKPEFDLKYLYSLL